MSLKRRTIEKVVLLLALLASLLIEQLRHPGTGAILLFGAVVLTAVVAAGIFWEVHLARQDRLPETESLWGAVIPTVVVGCELVRTLMSPDPTLWSMFAVLCLFSLYMGITRLIWKRSHGKKTTKSSEIVKTQAE